MPLNLCKKTFLGGFCVDWSDKFPRILIDKIYNEGNEVENQEIAILENSNACVDEFTKETVDYIEK